MKFFRRSHTTKIPKFKSPINFRILWSDWYRFDRFCEKHKIKYTACLGSQCYYRGIMEKKDWEYCLKHFMNIESGVEDGKNI